ncbi:MAG: YfhO family protein [Anaerolineae bacterium]|nr:YfhO family protein [Anaerolineae bacterium]
MSIVTPPSQYGTPKVQISPARWPDAVLLIILTLLPLLFFWRLVTPHPADRLHIVSGDFTEQYFPLRAFTAQQWVEGEIPLWNPYLYGGQPALADIQSGALYPPHVLQALLLGWGGPLFGREVGFPLWALEWQVIAHVSLAAAGMYLFMRQLGLESGLSLRRARFGGVIASLVFTYSGYLTGFPVQQMTILAVSAWLPWVMWAVSMANRRVSESPRLPIALRRASAPLAWGAVAFALACLAGHPQMVLYILYLTLAYTIFGAGSMWRRDTAPSLPRLLQGLARHLPGWLVIVGLGVAIAAVQLLPTVEFINHSLRADLSYQAVSAGLPLNELISIIYPGFFGGSPEYVGIVTLVFMGLALGLGRPRGEIYFWTGVGLVSLVLAFGGNTFLYSLFYLFAPGFEVVRQQERAFLGYSFSAAILAGYGATVLVGPLSKIARQRYARFDRRLRIVVVIIFGLTAFFIYGSVAATARGDEVNLFYGVLRHHLFGGVMLGGMAVWLTLRPRRWLRRRRGMALLAFWLAFELFTVNWRFNLEQRDTEPFGPNGVVQFLQTNLAHSPERIASGGLLPGGNSAASVYNLQDLTGNTPLQLATVDMFFRQMPAWRMWQLMNVRYVVGERDISSEGLTLVFAENGHYVFEVGDPFPRAWLVAQTEVIPDESQAIARLGNDSFDLRRSAVVAVPVDVPLAGASTSTITLVEFGPAYLRATVNATNNNLLVLSQIYYPGWMAKIDGQPANLLRVNVVQQGVVILPGEHTVELSFEPASFWWGRVISVVGLLGWLVLLAMGRFKKPRQSAGL